MTTDHLRQIRDHLARAAITSDGWRGGLSAPECAKLARRLDECIDDVAHLESTVQVLPRRGNVVAFPPRFSVFPAESPDGGAAYPQEKP